MVDIYRAASARSISTAIHRHAEKHGQITHGRPAGYLLALFLDIENYASRSSDVFLNTVNSPLTDTLVSGQLYLRTLFSIFPIFTSKPNSLCLCIPISGHSHKWARTLLKMEFGLFSLFALSPKRTPDVLHKLTTLTEQLISGDRFSQAVCSFDMTSRKSFSCYFWLPNKTYLRPLIYFSCKWTSTQLFFGVRLWE